MAIIIIHKTSRNDPLSKEPYLTLEKKFYDFDTLDGSVLKIGSELLKDSITTDPFYCGEIRLRYCFFKASDNQTLIHYVIEFDHTSDIEVQQEIAESVHRAVEYFYFGHVVSQVEFNYHTTSKTTQLNLDLVVDTDNREEILQVCISCLSHSIAMFAKGW